jgi:N-carbamoyl-L-amino-acid hydrolase
MTVTIDRIGNGFMRRPGRNNALPPVVTGSHIDTQPTGGKFDGNYGVLAGLEVVRTLNDHGIQTEAPIEVAWWTNEEGSRFVPVMMGSGVFAKAFTLEHAYAATDTEGKTVKGELERIGYIGSEEPGAHPIGTYFEAHIEQGPVLEDNDKTIGVVSGVLGIRWYDCTVTGMEAHAGPTPMALRKDALQVATRLMQQVVACAGRHPPHGRGTVGMVRCTQQPQRDSGPSSSASTCAMPAKRCAMRWMPTFAASRRASAPRVGCRSTSSSSRRFRPRSSTPTVSTRWHARRSGWATAT